MNLPKFSNIHHSLHAELKAKISEYFLEVGRSTTGNYQLFLKAVILMVSFVFIYIHLVFFTPVVSWQVLESIVLGGLVAAIGFNVMHDGAHGSFSRYPWLNKLAALSLNFLGANNFMWNTKHNIIHHAYTNVDGVDDRFFWFFLGTPARSAGVPKNSRGSGAAGPREIFENFDWLF